MAGDKVHHQTACESARHLSQREERRGFNVCTCAGISLVSHNDCFLFAGVEEEGMEEGAMVEVEEGMGEVEDTDQSRTLTSRLRLTSTTVVSQTHLVEGPTKATVRTREGGSLAWWEGVAAFLQHPLQG